MASLNYWTKERVIEGLKRFHATFEELPRSAAAYNALRRSLAEPQVYPPVGKVSRYFSSILAGWVEAGLMTKEEAGKGLARAAWGAHSRISLDHFVNTTRGCVTARDAQMALGLTPGVWSSLLSRREDLRQAWDERKISPVLHSAKAIHGAKLELEFIAHHGVASNQHEAVLKALIESLGGGAS
ncbi:MAG: hypothetical protein ABIP75_03210 [Pyrinomonadaceae bacterium]